MHWLTLAVLVALVVGVIGCDLQVGMAALTGAALLSLVGAADEKDAIRKMPWGVVLMVCGVTVLIGVLEKTQGMALFSDLLARVSTPGTVTFVVALRDRGRLGLQQHVGRRAAGVPADGARPGRTPGRRRRHWGLRRR